MATIILFSSDNRLLFIHKGFRASFKDALEQACAKRINLSGFELSKTKYLPNFFDPQFMSYSLKKAKLDGLLMKNATLLTIVLDGGSLVGADFSNSSFDYGTLEGADFTTADVSNCSFESVNLINTIFHDANLSGAYLKTAKLLHTRLAGANLKGVVWNDEG